MDPDAPPPLVDEIAAAEAEIAKARRDVEQQLETLQQAAEAATDWQSWYRSHPAVFLAAAFTLGFLLAR